MRQATNSLLWVAGVSIVLVLPQLVESYDVHVLSVICIFIVAAAGMNILVGYTGLVSLGHAGLFAIGAYTSALLSTRADVPFWPASFAGLLVAAATGAVLAAATLRARGIALAMVTIAFGLIVEQLALDQDAFTGGFMGIASIPAPEIAGIVLPPRVRLYLFLILAGISIKLVYNLRHSKWGRGLVAVRENDVAAASLGVSRYGMETLAFVLSAAFVGYAGALYAHHQAYIAPTIFSFDLFRLHASGGHFGRPRHGLGTCLGHGSAAHPPRIGLWISRLSPNCVRGCDAELSVCDATRYCRIF